MEIDERLRALEDAVVALEERNRRVERDKAWETSRARMISILLLTYCCMCLLFYAMRAEYVLASAAVPTLGYFLSVQSLPLIKRWWLRG